MGKRTKPTSNIKFLTPIECTELFETINQDTGRHAIRNIAIFHTAKYCGLRVSEIPLIKISDYDVINKTLYLRRLKGSRSNTLKIVDPICLQYFEEYYWMRKSITTLETNTLFISQKGAPISRKTLDSIMKNYCAVTSIPRDKQHFHVLKHTRAMELIEYSAVELRDLQWWLGHKNIQNTMLYLEYTATTMLALFDKLEQIEGRKCKESR